MLSKLRTLFWSGKSALLGVAIFGFLSGILQPIQNDTVHSVGILTTQGGKTMQPAQFVFGEGLFGRFTFLLTATVAPPVRGDILLEITGPEKLEYSVSSRYPPVVSIFNRLHTWFTFDRNMYKGVQPGDSLLLVLRIKPPNAPGKYTISLKDAHTGKVYLSQPAIFALPQQIGLNGKAQEDCH
jgi:hypothetical protein